jgi:hypothetical protein
MTKSSGGVKPHTRIHLVEPDDSQHEISDHSTLVDILAWAFGHGYRPSMRYGGTVDAKIWAFSEGYRNDTQHDPLLITLAAAYIAAFKTPED